MIDIQKNFQLLNNQNIQYYINILQKIAIKKDNLVLHVKSNNFYYKIYKDRYSCDLFYQIRENIAKYYNQTYNIIWQIKTIFNKNYIYQIQKREILKVCKNEKKQTLINVQKQILKKAQQNLFIKKYIQFLKIKNPDEFNNLKNVKLIRDQFIKNSDFAYKDDNIILLDDNDFAFVFIDNNNNIMQPKINYFEIYTTKGIKYLKNLYYIYWQIINIDFYFNKKIKIFNEKIEYNIQHINNIQKKYNITNIIDKLKRNIQLQDLEYIYVKNDIIYLIDKDNTILLKPFNFYKISNDLYLTKKIKEDYYQINLQHVITQQIYQFEIYKLNNAQQLYLTALKNNYNLVKEKISK